MDMLGGRGHGESGMGGAPAASFLKNLLTRKINFVIFKTIKVVWYLQKLITQNRRIPVNNAKFRQYHDEVRWMSARIQAGTNDLGDEVRLETSAAVG
ncbi:MAG: hypothetical protein ACRENG_10110 [bacterium]